LTQPQAFVREKEERLVFENRSAEDAAKIVLAFLPLWKMIGVRVSATITDL